MSSETKKTSTSWSNEKQAVANFVGINFDFFIIKPPEQWTIDKDYLDAKAIVSYKKVDNDVAERGVKLSSNFVTPSRIKDTL